jgi:GNAT superfamily N-acetyltransferase
MNTTPLSARNAAWLSDKMEAVAFTDLYAAAPDEVRTRLGLQIQYVADATLLIASNLPSPMFNRCIGLGMAGGADINTVSQIMSTFKAAGNTRWWLHWNPFASPDDLPQRLQELGFVQPPRHSWAKMLHDAAPAPMIKSDLQVALVRDDQVSEVANAIAQAFEMPPLLSLWLQQLHDRPRWRLYAVTDADKVVGGGCQFLDGHAAWMGMGGILATHRRRGGQGKLMSYRIDDAIGAGCRFIATETGEAMSDEINPSLLNMQRCGFNKVASRLNFAAP